MLRLERYIFKDILAIFLLGLFCLYTFPVYAQSTGVEFNNISPSETQKNILLRYSKTHGLDHFVFEFPDGLKIPYDLKSSANKTVITFARVFRLNTLDLARFPDYKKIVQRELPNRHLEITFPRPLAASAELVNSIILDFSADSQNVLAVVKEKITPMQIASLGFSWNAPVALSVFKRGKYLWIVFNQYQQIKTDELLKNANGIIKDIIQLPHTSATILRLEAIDEVYSETRKEGLLWIVDLYNNKTDRRIIPISVNTDVTIPLKPFLRVNMPGIEDIYSFLDPEIGDILMAVTSSTPGYGYIHGYKYADFAFLPTSQGMAINTDDINLSLIRSSSGFTLQTTQHPLHLSTDQEKIKKISESQIAEEEFSILKDVTMPIIRKTFVESETYLKSQIKNAESDEAKDKYTLDLARYYLSYSLGSNAMGKLREIRDNLQSKKKTVSHRLNKLVGVAAFLMKRYDQAYDIFSRPEFADYPEIQLWKQLSDTNEQIDYSSDILRNIHFVYDYPVTIKKNIVLRGVVYAIDKKSDALAQAFLNVLKELPPTNETFAAYNYYDAEKIRLQGYLKSSLSQYRAAALSRSSLYSALARFRIADFNRNIANAKQNRTIQEFERLRFSWGEKQFKINVLNSLVDLYLKTTNFYMALKTLNDLSNLSGNQKSAIEQRMIQIMEEIYYYNNDNQFDPIKALALFDDFGYLIERSPHQTAIVIKLADRLVAVDLLQRAEQLLNSYMQQKHHSLSHNDLSAMGGRLALIDLFRNDENSAIKHLKETEFYDINETLRLQRKIIEAKALVQLGDIEKALDMLAGNNSKNALLLKSQIYWDSERWDEASDTIRFLVEKPVEGQPLSDEQIRYILDWLTALKLAGKETVIVRIRNTFMPYFEKTPYASLFNLLTDKLEQDTISIKQIDKTIQNIQTFSNFARQYTQSLMRSLDGKDNKDDKENVTKQ